MDGSDRLIRRRPREHEQLDRLGCQCVLKKLGSKQSERVMLYEDDASDEYQFKHLGQQVEMV